MLFFKYIYKNQLKYFDKIKFSVKRKINQNIKIILFFKIYK